MANDQSLPESSETLSSEEAEKQRKRRAAAQVVDEWKRSQERAKEADRKFLRLSQRSKYRRDREASGRPVRPYQRHDIAPRQPGESWEDYNRRVRRVYRRADPASVRSYTDLSEMTAEEKSEHRRQKQRERKRKQREKERAGASPSAEELAFLKIQLLSEP